MTSTDSVVDMAAVPYRIYLLFSALIPSLIYALVAAILVGLLTLRVTENDTAQIAFFFGVLCFTASFKMIKDQWNLWPYAIYAKKFRIDVKDEISIQGKATYDGYLSCTYQASLAFSMISSILVFGIAYYATPFAFSLHPSILWLIGSLAFPIVLMSALLISADIFYRSYANVERSNNVDSRYLTTNQYLKYYYLYPDAFCFIALNFAIIHPLRSVQSEPFDVAWVTMLATICISTLLILGSAYSNPIKLIVGGLNSRLIKLTDIKKMNLNVNEKDVESAYTVKRFSFIPWLICIIIAQVALATVLMKNVDYWFYYFLISAQAIWLVSYLYLRYAVLNNALKLVVKHHAREDLQEGYIDLESGQKA